MSRERSTSCCRMLIGLETSKISADTLESQSESRILLKFLGILCMLHPGNDLCNNSSGRSDLCKDSAATLSFVKRSLNDKYDGTMKEMVQRQEDVIFSSGIEVSINTMLLPHSRWMNHLVRHDFLGCNLDILEFAYGSVLAMTDDSHAKNLCAACWQPRWECRRSSPPKPQNTSRNER